jgi:hypothetical protein
MGAGIDIDTDTNANVVRGRHLDWFWRQAGRLAFPIFSLIRWLSLTRTMRFLTRHLRLPGWIPLLGNIDGRYLSPPVTVWFDGRRSMSAPTLKIVIDGLEKTTSPGALQPVSEKLFDGRPRFVFNVCFSCGRGATHGVYADPESIWFNVFFGYYQIDVPKELWGRPFGYLDSAIGATPQIRGLDLVTIGEADWNYFSNFLYGVPLEVVNREVTIDETSASPQGRRLTLEGRQWDVVLLDHMAVSSAYVANERDLQMTPHPVLRALWRAAFGGPPPRRSAVPGVSAFASTTMSGRILMYWREDAHDRNLKGPVYRTFIFGATIDQSYPDRLVALATSRAGALPAGEAERIRAQAIEDNRCFLRAQNAAIEALIRREYGDLGWTEGSTTRGAS